MFARTLTCLTLAFGLAVGHAAEELPEVFAGILPVDKPVKAQLGTVLPPSDIDKYVAKVAAAARSNPEWFKDYTAKAKPGVPLPYHENLGLTQEEYDDYIKLWGQREFKANEEVMLLLRQSSDDSWIITATGGASTLSTMRYEPATDTFRSPNGELERLEDIDASADSILGAWKGREWRFQEETGLGQTKENIALGQTADGKYSLIVYRAQEMTAAGTKLLDKSLVIRFPALAKP
ncbi:MAG: hypothetical protein R3242_02220 [Akkermansiaceae bacterium]|nr:hypothetical protein [Akkermansiaceae bacterium]